MQRHGIRLTTLAVAAAAALTLAACEPEGSLDSDQPVNEQPAPVEPAPAQPDPMQPDPMQPEPTEPGGAGQGDTTNDGAPTG